MTEASLVALSEELHRRLHVQARNLLFEYKFSAVNPGLVPVEAVEKLMRLYGNLIAELIFKDQEKSRQENAVDGLPPPKEAVDIRPLHDWHEDLPFCVLWWKFPICEPPYCGSPLCESWPFTAEDEAMLWFTPIKVPDEPQEFEDAMLNYGRDGL